MDIINNFCSLFPKCKIGTYNDHVDIIELENDAKVKKLTLTNANFSLVDPKIVKDFSSIFQKYKSNKIFFLDCDGIVACEIDDKKYIFLLELKSKFDTRDVFKAHHQIIASYIKFNMLLNLLEDYNADDFIFKAFIACLPIEHDYYRELHKMSLLPTKNKFKSEAEFAIDLYMSPNKSTLCKKEECFKIKDLHIGRKCMFDSLEYNLIEANKDSESISIDIKKYILSRPE